MVCPTRLVAGIVLGLGVAAACPGLDVERDPTVEDYFFGQPIRFPSKDREKVFPAAKGRANFTFFHGVDQVAVRDGKLVFTLAESKATLGWGNHMGRQPVADVRDMWQQENAVRLRIKQSADQSKWTVRLWCDGRRQEKTATVTAEGQAWQEVALDPLEPEDATPDGLEFTIEGTPGARIELEWLKLVQRACEGYCRTEFVLPEGKIWRAVAEVGSANGRHWVGRDEMASRLVVNGEVADRAGSLQLYHTAPVDLASYLKPGPNCVGFYGFRIKYAPFIYFQAKIVMESGEVVTVASGRHWKYSPREVEGWSRPGFDDSNWADADRAYGQSHTGRDAAWRLNIPAYGGRLVMKNPARRDLFYADNDPVVVEVHVPPGLKDQSPALAYLLGQADAEGRPGPATEGTIAQFDQREGSLVFRLDLGRLDHGVYGLALRLTGADGSTIDERPREPLVVLRKLSPERIAGSDYLEGLELELEDTIDFTDPDDPHPWIESRAPAERTGGLSEAVTAPTVQRRGDLHYREVTDPRRGSGFSYRFEFKHPGSFYLLELEYPDDAKRTFDLLVSTKTEKVWTNSQSGVGAETGGRFLPTAKMLTLRWIHVADPGVHSADLINVVDGEKAAARSLKIHRILGDLPSVGAGRGRSYGIHSERCFYSSGMGMNFGVGPRRDRQIMQEEDKNRPPMQQFFKDLVWLQQTGERYVAYLKFAGQNCHVMGCFQYYDYNSPYAPAVPIDDSRVLWCPKTMMANLFELAGIDFYAGVEFSQSQDVRTYANNAQIARGADTVWMVDAEGRQRYGLGKRAFLMVPNWLHPQVRASYCRLTENLANTFGHLSRFRGVHGCLGPSVKAGYWMPGFGRGNRYDEPLDVSFDDVTAARFQKDTGIQIPVANDDPRRFQKRAALLTSPALRPRFIQWRGQKLKGFFADAVQILRNKRGDLELVNALWVEDTDFFQHLARSGKPFAEVMKEFAIDLDELNTVDGLTTGRWTISWRSQPKKLPSQDPYCWLARTRADVIAAFEPQRRRSVLVRTSWDENLFWSGGHAMKARGDTDSLVQSDWIMNVERTRALPQPGGYHCREAYIQAVITGDPHLLLGGMTDININVGHEQMLRGVLVPYTHLPSDRFQPALDTGLDTNLAIRQLTKGGESYFYVANPCQWHVTGSVTVQTGGEVTELIGGEAVATGAPGGSVEVPVSLTPFGLVAFRVTSPQLAITAYDTEPMAAEELARVTSILDRVEELLAHPQARLGLAPDDRSFMQQGLAKIREAMADRQYAQAWSMMTNYRFWSLWQDFLEKAAAEAGPPSSQVAEITYDQARNCICVAGFPEDQPATMETILAADKRNRWGKVTYDRRTRSYLVDAALWIGDDQSNGTFVQIGDAAHPKVTVVVNGTVWVRPPKESPKRSDGRDSVINRLTLGDSEDENVRATLKIYCDTRGQHGVYVGYRSQDNKTWIRRGALHVYNSTITAAQQDPEHVWGAKDYTDEKASPRWSKPGWYGSDIRLKGATISWFGGTPAYGTKTGSLGFTDSLDLMRPDEANVIEGTTFEHGQFAIANRQHYLRNCVFRNMKIAMREGGALSAKLVNCTFEDNESNWTLGSLQARGIIMIDCKVGRQKTPIALKKNTIEPEDAAKQNIPVYPACVVRESLVLKVVDDAGNPVPYAWVTASCKSDPEQLTRGATLTDQNGLTPSDPETDAIVVTVKKYQATDDPEKPKETAFAYEVSVTKAGFEPKTATLPAGRSPPRPLVVTLQRGAAGTVPAPDVRTWTDATGQFRTEAVLVDFDGTVVRLRKPDGHIVTIPVARLSEADRRFLDSLDRN